MLSSAAADDALAWLSLPLSASDDGGAGADFFAVLVAGGAVSTSCKRRKRWSLSGDREELKAGCVKQSNEGDTNGLEPWLG